MDVAERIKVSANAIRRWSEAGRFPSPVKLGRAVRWSEAAVDKWIAQQGTNA
jgi:excisionase family DNA binding protein